MENEEMKPSYWPSVIQAAIIVAVVTSVVGLGLVYYVAGSEPSMGVMMISGLSIPITCLIGLIGGILATRSYAKAFDITFPIGTGAQIGLFTGIIAAVVGGIIGQIWGLVDPSLMERFADTMIGAFEMNDQIPEAQKDEIITSMEEGFEDQSSMGGILKGIAINAGVLGFVNLLSGMVGAKIFASEEE
ncbi:MAG: DUF4199 family protein [Balneola sp.]